MTTNARIDSVAVLGAGTMGAQIAAHVANAGLPVLLLDLDDRTAREGLTRAKALKPDPFFSADAAALVATGGFDSDISRLADADWILSSRVYSLESDADAVVDLFVNGARAR